MEDKESASVFDRASDDLDAQLLENPPNKQQTNKDNSEVAAKAPV